MASKFGASLKSVGKPSSSSKFSKEEKGKTSVTLKSSKDTKSEKIAGSSVASKSKEEEKAKVTVAAKPEEKGKVNVASKFSKTEQKGKLSISSKFSKEEEKGPKGQKTTRTKEEETRVEDSGTGQTSVTTTKTTTIVENGDVSHESQESSARKPTVQEEIMSVEGGVYENEPVRDPEIVRESDPKNIGEELPEVGMAKNILQRYAKIQEESAKPVVGKRQASPPKGTGPVEYVSEPRTVIEKPEQKVEGGIFENQPVTEEGVVKSYDTLEDVKPEQGYAKNVLAKFKEIESQVQNRPPPSPKRELTPDRFTKGEYVSEPRSTFEKYEGKTESGIFESQPKEDRDVVLLLAEAQGLSIYGRLGIRKILGDAGKSVLSQQYCWSYTSEMILECVKQRNSFQLPRITAANESIVFPDNLFSQMCLIFGTIRNCYESIVSEECKSSMPQIYANSKALATKFCNNEKDLESLLGCINRPSFQSMFQEPNSENLQQQGVCRMIKNKLDQILQTTQSVCGQVDYRTLVRVLVNFGQDLSFVTEELSDYSAHCVISVNQVMPDAAVAVDVSQA